MVQQYQDFPILLSILHLLYHPLKVQLPVKMKDLMSICRKTYSPIAIRHTCSSLVMVIEIMLQFHAELEYHFDGIGITLVPDGELLFVDCVPQGLLSVSLLHPSSSTLSHSFSHTFNTIDLLQDASRSIKFKTCPVRNMWQAIPVSQSTSALESLCQKKPEVSGRSRPPRESFPRCALLS